MPQPGYHHVPLGGATASCPNVLAFEASTPVASVADDAPAYETASLISDLLIRRWLRKGQSGHGTGAFCGTVRRVEITRGIAFRGSTVRSVKGRSAHGVG